MTTKNLTSRLLRTLLAAVALSVALATPSTSAADEPVEGAAGGCALQCIEKALVAATASSAKVAIKTAVPTTVVVTARRLSSAGRIDGPAIKGVGPTLSASRTVFLYGLEPKRTYSIHVAATDAAGKRASRSGRFTTRAVQTAGEPGAGGLSSGLGCSAKCITKAVPVHVGPTAAMFDVATNTPARVTVITSRAGTGSIVSIASSRTHTRSYRATASPLDPGTRYDLRVRATDANGHTEAHQFSFRTVERKARVTFWKIQVIEDGDPGIARGEMAFSYTLGGNVIQSDGFAKRSSGDVFDVHPRGSSRPGLTGVLPANGAAPTLDVRVFAQECDTLRMQDCTAEVISGYPSGGTDYSATAGGAFGLGALVPKAALPAGFGTMLPSGHSAYLVFETTKYSVKFRVFATVDYFYAW